VKRKANAPRDPVQQIGIDCPPGDPRPGDLIDDVIAGTGLPRREAASKMFGAWTWDYSDIAADEWKRARPILNARLTALCRKKIVRGVLKAHCGWQCD